MKRYVRIMKGVPEFMYMNEQTARMIAGKGGWIPSPEPKKIEKEVWTPEEPEEEEVEIDTTIRAEGVTANDFVESLELPVEVENTLAELAKGQYKELQLTETPVVKRGRKPKQ